MSLQERIQSDLVEAMKTKDALKLGVLRMMKSALKNKEIEKRESLDTQTVRSVLQTLVKQRRDSAEQFRKGNREELADTEEREILVINQYLPRPASDAEIQTAVQAAIAETDAKSMKDMGRVMKAAMARLGETTVNGGKISALARTMLTNQ